ncbi:Enolase-like protein ENO4 [Myotis davidii]|uniref:phosphopyruvate hydratase n=1 Tax=Myotis davidii TaxID=225400 RepID=L5MG94_MYODS|nr:Enolase-like protein ENO4 [Myotis davidii]
MGDEGGGRGCGPTRELRRLKQQALEYYRENDVPRRLEELLNSTFYLQPADVYGHLVGTWDSTRSPPAPPPRPRAAATLCACAARSRTRIAAAGWETAVVREGDPAGQQPSGEPGAEEIPERKCFILFLPSRSWIAPTWLLLFSHINDSAITKVPTILFDPVEKGNGANCLSKLAKPPTICKVVGKHVLDGLGLPTLQVEIFCTIQNFPKYICSVMMATHFEVYENAVPELAEAMEAERLDAVSTAVRWVNENITQELQGLEPSNQAEVDQVLRTFFENKVQEDNEGKELEKSLEKSAVHLSSSLMPPPTTPPPPPPAKKKGQKQGRKSTIIEKPIPPPEPVEPVLCGSMAIGAVSLAVAKTIAVLDSNPLYFHIASLKHHQEQPAKLTIPLLMVSLVSCGKSSPGKLNLMKEVICIPHPGLMAKQGVEMLMEIQKQISKTIETPPPPKAEMKKGHNGGKRGQQPVTGKMSHLGCLTINYDTIEQPLLTIQGVCANLGLELGTNLYLAINCAAHELVDYSKGKYEVMMGTYKNTTEMVDLYVDLISKFPSIIALIDPFRKEDSEQWDSLYNALGSRCYLIAGSASKSIATLLEEGDISTPRSSGRIIKHTNQTTLSDLVEISNLMDSKKHLAVFGSAEGESADDSLVDLAIGLGVQFIKLGGLSRGERVTKYNRIFTIEEELVRNGTLGFKGELTFVQLSEEDEKADEEPEAVAAEAGELPGRPEPIFPTEVIEEAA